MLKRAPLAKYSSSPLHSRTSDAQRAMVVRSMKIRIKDGLPVEETAIVSEEDNAEAEALIERMENEIVTKLNSTR